MVDIVKGLAISLVTLGHTNQGIMHRDMWGSGVGMRIDQFIYSFHMPAFFFVSGVFLYASLRKRGWGHFVRSKVATILYPFWLWALVLPLTPLVLGRFMISHAPTWKAYLLNLVTGNGEWFLPTLFVTMMVAALLYRVPAWIALIAALLLQHYCRWPGSVDAVRRMWEHLPFLLAGVLVGARVGVLEKLSRAAALALAAPCGAILYWCTPFEIYPYYWRAFPIGLLGTAMLFLLARAMGNDWLGRTFAWVGIASLGVYILSPFGQGLGRTLLFAVHVRQPLVHLLFATLLATWPPAWIYQHRVRLRIAWLFVWPGMND